MAQLKSKSAPAYVEEFIRVLAQGRKHCDEQEAAGRASVVRRGKDEHNVWANLVDNIKALCNKKK